MLQLRYFKPRPDLAPFLGAYYICDSSDANVQPIAAEMANIRFILRGEMETIWDRVRISQFEGAQLVGPTMRAYAMRSRGATRMFGAGVKPRGWAAMPLGGADAFADRMENLLLICARPARAAYERMLNAATDAEIVTAADDLFSSLIDPGARAAQRFPRSVDAFLAQRAGSSVDALAEAAGLSRRHLDRVMRGYYGVSPKGLLRKRRAIAAAEELALNPGRRLADLAAGAFYDQPHFTREFRTFIGVTPARFISGGATLMAKSMKLRALAQ